MNPNDPRQHLQDALDSIQQIQKYFEGKNPVDLEENDMLFDAIVMRLQVIGEAVKKLPKSMHEQYPQIPWREIIALRNYISHAYSFLDASRFYNIIVEELPKLEKVLRELFAQSDQ
jgi:uncharacterized protein with HEPN domain